MNHNVLPTCYTSLLIILFTPSLRGTTPLIRPATTVIALIALAALFALAAQHRNVAAAPFDDHDNGVVEDDMHEFMEYYFQPTYKRLKAVMAKEPADAKGWKPIKADSLILAEGGNLLLHRMPKKGGDLWRKLSIAVRTEGGKFYHAAQKKNWKDSRAHYERMLKNCNACHQEFARGKYQLAP